MQLFIPLRLSYYQAGFAAIHFPIRTASPMKKFFVVLGTLLAAVSWLTFSAGREANRRTAAAKIPAKKAAELLSEAWADHHTRV